MVYFILIIVFVFLDGCEEVVEGLWLGCLVYVVFGFGGFGYDLIFFFDG